MRPLSPATLRAPLVGRPVRAYVPPPPPLTFRAALVAALKGAAAVAAVAGANVFPLKVPQGKGLPALLFHFESVRRLHDLDGATDVSVADVRLGCGARSYSDCVALSRAVRALLDGYTGALSGVRVQETTLDAEQDLYDPAADGSDAGAFWTVLDYRFRFLEPTP